MRKIALVVLDGFGVTKETYGNAIKKANMPYFKSLLKKYSNTTIKTHGEYVGLNKGQFGNSEVGHLNLGAGRVVVQNSMKISNAVKTGEIFTNKKLLKLFSSLKKSGKILHLFGLCSDGGVHADFNHVYSLVKMAKNNGVKDVYIHFISDGRDTKVDSGILYYNKLNKFLKKENYGKIISVQGRFFAMDREKNYDRTQKFLDVILNYSAKNQVENFEDYFKQNYEKQISDENLEPCILKNSDYSLKQGDAILAFNFRSDRMKQIFELLIKNNVQNLNSFIEYDVNFKDVNVIFEEESNKNCLSEILSINNLSQLRISETTKYAHVTYFFNMLIEKPFKNEERIIIPSDKIESFDEKPKMKAKEITDTVILKTDEKLYDFILINYPNCDMVGHTGNFNATVTAVEFLDKCLEKLCEDLKQKGYTILITADHGNADKMLNADGTVCTTHSTRNAPFIIVEDCKFNLRTDGKLSNVSPTILALYGIKQPKEFKEESLIV